MKKILFHCPDWGNRWVLYITSALSERFDVTVSHEISCKRIMEQSEQHDILLSAWANEIVAAWTHNLPEKKIVTYLRRYEMFSGLMSEIVWGKVSAVIFVNAFFQKLFNTFAPDGTKTRRYLIYNGVDIDDFPLVPSAIRNKKLAFVASLKGIKNFAMACQILRELPKEYTLHQIGIFCDPNEANAVAAYASNLGVLNRIEFGKSLQRDKVADWLRDKSFLLSTSINEGNPNNIIEAMAMGIQPVIHNWPGSRDQFPEDCIFNTVDEAVTLIRQWEDPAFVGFQAPGSLRRWVQDRYSLSNFNRLADVIDEESADCIIPEVGYALPDERAQDML